MSQRSLILVVTFAACDALSKMKMQEAIHNQLELAHNQPPTDVRLQESKQTRQKCAMFAERVLFQKNYTIQRKASARPLLEALAPPTRQEHQRQKPRGSFDFATTKAFSTDKCQLTDVEVKFAQCPPGYYLGHDDEGIKTRNQRLRNAICTAKNRGWVSGLKNEDLGDNLTNTYFRTRKYMTYESALWPKPSRCASKGQSDWHANHAGLPVFRPDRAPSQYNKERCPEYNIEFLKSWKVASMTFPDYLDCEYSACNWVEVSVQEPNSRELTELSAVREPIARWVSAIGELLERGLNQWCPEGPCTEEDGWIDGDEDGSTRDRLFHETSWFNYVKSGYNSSDLSRIIQGFMTDTVCNVHFYASEHFSTQSNFLSQNKGMAANLSFIVKLESADSDLSEMAEFVKGFNDTDSSCSLVPHNVAECKPGADTVPSSDDIEKILEASEEHIKELCLIYAQDFICFDYDLPAVCEGMF